MGTLGCINDMLRRDKENRELRKVGKERLHETHRRLLTVKESSPLPDMTPEELSDIMAQTKAYEAVEKKRIFRFTLLFFGAVAVGILLAAGIFLLFV